MKQNLVYIHKGDISSYPPAPFHPPEIFPEFKSLPCGPETDPENHVYRAVRETLIQLGLDESHIGTAEWKPFRDFVKPGQHVVIKPNFVRGDHPLGEIGVLSMVTHASLMRPVIDYVLLTTGGDCKITICDVPLQSSAWEEIITQSGTKALVDFYSRHGIRIGLLDLRREISHANNEKVIDQREFADRDPLGYAAVDLGGKSALMPVIQRYKQFMITDYDKGTVGEHHNPKKNEYCIAKTILDADFFINMPKLKTHRKAGLTLALKNLIGMNGDKRWIAHHREGSVALGGDEFPRYNLRNWFEFRLFTFLKRHPAWGGVWLATQIYKAHRLIFRLKHSIKLKLRKAWARDESSPLEEAGFETFKREFPNTSYETYRGLNPNPNQKRFMEGSWYGNDTLWRTVTDLNHIIFYADKNGILRETIQRNYFCLADGIMSGEGEGPMGHLPKKIGVVMGGLHPLAVDFSAAWIMGFDAKKIPVIDRLFGNTMVNYPGLTPASIEMRSNVDLARLDIKFKPSNNWQGHIERT